MYKQILAVLLFLVLLAPLGCVGAVKAYPGASRSDSETALLKPQGVTLRRVNGVEISAVSSGARVLPGSSEVEVTIDASNITVPDIDAKVYKLKIEAKAGVSYAITGQRGVGQLCAFPIDPNTGLVSGTNPAGCLVRE